MAIRPIPPNLAANIATSLGYHEVIIIARAEGEDGGECIAYGGDTYKHGKIAEEMAHFLQDKVMGWNRNAPDERDFNDPNLPDPHETGKRIIIDGLERRGRK